MVLFKLGKYIIFRIIEFFFGRRIADYIRHRVKIVKACCRISFFGFGTRAEYRKHGDEKYRRESFFHQSSAISPTPFITYVGRYGNFPISLMAVTPLITRIVSNSLSIPEIISVSILSPMMIVSER